MIDDQVEPQDLVQMVSKMELIVTQLHESLLENVEHAQKKHRVTYVIKKGCIMFHSFGKEKIWLKMCKLGKKKFLLVSWEGPYLFDGYKDG